MRRVYKIISLILINAFLLLDIAWAGNMDLYQNENVDTLGAHIQINAPEFLNSFVAAQTAVSPEFSYLFLAEGYARVYDLLTNEHIGFYVDGIVYGRDGSGEFKQSLGRFNSKTQTFTKPEQDNLFTIKIINDLIGEGESDQGKDKNLISWKLPFLGLIGGGLIWGWDEIKAFIVQNQVLLTNIGLSLAVISLSFVVGVGIYVFYKNYKRFIRSINPVREQWYIWRLGLNAKSLIDQAIIARIYGTYSRKGFLEEIRSSLKYYENKQKIITLDKDLKRLDDLNVERFSIAFKKLSRMGTDAFYFKPFKLFRSAEKTDKSSNKKTTLQASSLATVGAFIMTAMDNANALILHNLIAVVALALGGIVIIAASLMYKPLRMHWYVWRLGLDRGQEFDLVIINQISSTNNRKQLLNSINSSIQNIQKAGNMDIDDINLEDSDEANSNDLYAERLESVREKLYSMGTDAGYFKVLYWIYSNTYRVYYYKIVLKLKNNKNFDSYYYGEFLSKVRKGWNQKELINVYLKPNLINSDARQRRAAINILNKFVNAGLLAQTDLVKMYFEVLEAPLSDATTDVIFGLKDYIKDIDQAKNIKLILKLQTIIEKKEKEVKKAKPIFNRADAYTLKYAAKKDELLKFQALYIHMVMNLFSNFEQSENINDIIKIVDNFKKYVDLLGEDVNRQCNEYLDPILAVLIKNRDQLAGQLKPESLPHRILNNIPGKNNKNAADKLVKNQLKQTVDLIKLVYELLKELENKRNNYGILSRMLLRGFDAAGDIIIRNKRKKDMLEQTKKDIIEQAKIGEKIGLVDQVSIGFIEQAI